MFELFTNRLRLIPLELDDFKLFLDDRPSLEKKLGLKSTNETLWPEFCRMNEWLSKRYTYLLGVVDWKAVYLWHTLWFIVLQEESRIIGCIFFHGEPNAKLEIEIGEYLWENYREKGYGTETLQKFIEYAFNETEVKTILWRILKSNPCRLASQRMVEKMGMVNSHETDTAFLYKLTKHRNSTSVVEKMEHC